MKYRLLETAISPIEIRYKQEDTVNCAICRLHLKGNCIDHIEYKNSMRLAHYTSNNTKTYYINEQQNLYDFLILLKECHIYRFSILPKDIIKYIVKFVSVIAQLKKRCPIVYLNCRHNYHKSCWERWITKRDCCPLCNKKSEIVYKRKYCDVEIYPTDYTDLPIWLQK